MTKHLYCGTCMMNTTHKSTQKDRMDFKEYRVVYLCQKCKETQRIIYEPA